ncbi:putative bifunctional diguanylate cyclase/phosphodiesterase [Paraburkholderia sp. RL17-337-BIB-A]|uniref:putative bifunctional diguanylate cyclase/phosphodiesterase n=1 Tax=Paraburkholderia sp. RL17-337-BIB-A TaxID=3031636 RepID=UPI0038B85FE2
MVGAAVEDVAKQLARVQRRLDRERQARFEAEAIAERGLRELYERQQELQLLEAIAGAANQMNSVQEALQFAVTHICQFTGWPLGHAYVTETGGDSCRLRPIAVWHGAQHARIHDFLRTTEQMIFASGVGLPGRVLATGAPVWITDVTEDGNFPRSPSARYAGLKAAFAFPVLVGNEVMAVLEFFTDRISPPDEPLQRLMSQVGTQLGRVIERQRAEDRLVHRAFHDYLTELPNRAMFLDRLGRAVARQQDDPDYQFAVLFIDLDRFKVINDSLGHLAGDQLIAQVAGRFLTSLRHGDTVSRSGAGAGDYADSFAATLARLGGDEFTILLDDMSSPRDAEQVAQRIQDALKRPFGLEGQEVYTSASIGIATSAVRYASATDVLRDADLAMYRAKTQGKARHEVYNEAMHESAMVRLKLETDLRRALLNQEFVVHYQPIVSLKTREVAGFEALVRWQKSPSELVYPGEFIAVTEDTGLILFLGMWVLREACRTLCDWQKEFPRDPPLTVSVNVSARQFNQPDLVKHVRQIIDETGVDPATVTLEITESVTMNDAEHAIRILSQLREIGVRFSIDDFGTGYSSLSYLHRLPLDILKIDRSFISAMSEGGESLSIVRTIMRLAKDLGIDVVAEGTETIAQLDHLNALDCEFGQGYYFSRPLDASNIREMLEVPRAVF